MFDPVRSRDLPPNPNFGSGIFRRRIRLRGKPGKVIAELEDCYHGFRSVVHHDDNKVTAIDAETLRFPLSICSEAVKPLQDLVGISLTADTRTITSQVNPRANCTHLYDLTLLAISHCLRGESTRQFDVTIPDEKDGPTEATVTLNNQCIFRWSVSDFVIQNEGALNDLTLSKGFGKWASQTFSGDEREAALILQRGYFVSGARRFDVHKLAGLSVTETESMLGACYSYSTEHIARAVRSVSGSRDFTNTPEQLLMFK